ncbi:MAG TPA: helix-turn-helix domain-containing protein [Jiangellaceae bacterium]
MAERAVPPPSGLADLPVGDLFTLADALADLVGAPVTIEDRDTVVLAFSDGQVKVDEARTATILGRRVPQRYQDALRDAGVFEQLATREGVVYADLAGVGMKPRAVVAVRADGELIGSIWAALDGPPTTFQERALLESVPVVAEHLVLDRNRRDLARRTRFELVGTVLRGGAGAGAAAARLGLPAGELVVAAIVPLPGESQAGVPALPATVAARAERLADGVALHLAAVQLRCASALVGGTVYVVARSDVQAARRVVADFLSRNADRPGIVAGIGRGVAGPDEAHRSRSDSDDVVRALLARRRAGVVASLDEVFLDVVTLRVADSLEADGLGDHGPLPALAAHDRDHGTELVASARAYLAEGGDVRDAAEALHVHPNTLRNRVRRAKDACGVDLDDADTRLAVMLQLRAAGLASPPR